MFQVGDRVQAMHQYWASEIGVVVAIDDLVCVEFDVPINIDGTSVDELYYSPFELELLFVEDGQVI